MKNARSLFEQGRYLEVVDSVEGLGRTASDSCALICSLAFLGRLEEACETWELRSKALSVAERSRARFALAVAYTRVSKFKTARGWLKASLKESKDVADVFQGLAFYHYYLGNFERSEQNARQALNLALKHEDSYMHSLAIDLYGHALVQAGQRSAGLSKLAQAQSMWARKGGTDPHTPARLVYEAEVGLRPTTIVAELEKGIADLRLDDTYTRANLVLELARQLTLHGEWARARSVLDQISSTIYSFQNRRQEATLQLRLAELAFRQGDASGATHFLQAARRCLHRIADVVYEARVLGLELKIERKLLGREPSSAAVARLVALTNLKSASIATRIAVRSDVVTASADVRLGEDPLGDLLDLVKRENAPDELLKAGYLGLWPEARRLSVNSLVILEDLGWVAVSREGVSRGEHLSQLSYKIIRTLSSGVVGKDRLVRDVWGYEYDPLRHDSMIYTALATLRKTLGVNAHWIETQDEGWTLCNRGAHVAFIDREAVELPAVVIATQESSDLNWRQLKALKKPVRESKEGWTVPRYRETFSVSTMTAWRDLDLLAKFGYLTRTGRGRATVYLHSASQTKELS